MIGTTDDILELVREKDTAELVGVLDARYGKIVNRDDLLTDFMSHNQDPNESCSEYFSELYLEVT